MTSNPSPGGSQEPPSFSQVEVDDFCRRLEPTLEPHEIGPAEVHTLGAPMQDEYVTVSRRIWHETSARCLDNEIRAARLAHELAVEKKLHDQSDRNLRAAERAILWHERRNRGLTRALWSAAVCCAVAVMLLMAIWRSNV